MEDNKALGVLGIIVSLAWCANCLIAVYLIMQVSLHCLTIITLLRNTNHTDLLYGKLLSIVFDTNVKQRRGPYGNISKAGESFGFDSMFCMSDKINEMS